MRDFIHSILDNLGVALSTIGGGVAALAGIAPWIVENHVLVSSCVGMLGLIIGIIGLRIQIRRDARERQIHALQVRNLLANGSRPVTAAQETES